MSKTGPAPRVGKARPPLRLLLFSPFLSDAERNRLVADMLAQAAADEPRADEARPRRRRAPPKQADDGPPPAADQDAPAPACVP